MKNTLRLRFVFSYLIIALLTLILLNTYGHSAIYNKLVEYEKSKLYEEAELIAREYMPSISIRDTVDITLLKHFSALETLTNMRVWIVSPDGNIQMDSNVGNSSDEYKWLSGSYVASQRIKLQCHELYRFHCDMRLYYTEHIICNIYLPVPQDSYTAQGNDSRSQGICQRPL